MDAEYDFVPNPESDYFTLVFYFTETRSKHPIYLKMEEALRLLQLGYSVKDVSYKVGYHDASAFGRSFKQIYGKSPASYVKK